MLNNDFDLDALAPEAKTIKLSGKLFKCFPPTINQLIKMQKAWETIAKKPSAENMAKIMDTVLYELLPDLKKFPEIGVTYEQMTALIQFVQGMAVDTSTPLTKASQEVAPQKKTV